MSMLFLKREQVDDFINRCTISLFLKYHERVTYIQHVSGLSFIGMISDEQVLIKLFNKPESDWYERYANLDVKKVILFKRNNKSAKMDDVMDERTNPQFDSEYKEMEADPFSYIMMNMFSGHTLIRFGNLKEYCTIPTDICLDTVLYKYKSFPDSRLPKRVLKKGRKQIQEFIDGTLAFCSPWWFNDPFDSDCEVPAILSILTKLSSLSKGNYSVDELLDTYHEQLEYWENKILQEQIPDNVNVYELAMDSLLHSIDPLEAWSLSVKNIITSTQNIKELFRVLCMTPHHDDILMWGYYGDSGKGLCGGFKRKEIIEGVKKIGNCILVYGKVVYNTVNNQQPKYTGRKKLWRFILDCVFTKAGIWKHEDEERFLLLDPQNIDTTKNQPELIKAIRHNGFRGINTDNSEWGLYTKTDFWPKLKKHATEYKLL